MFVKVTVVLSLLTSLLVAEHSFATIDRGSSGRMSFYRHAITAPTLVNTGTSALALPQFSRPGEPMSNPDSVFSVSGSPSSLDEITRKRITRNYGKLPLRFEANVGQTDGQVKFLTRGSGYRMYFTPTETVMVLSQRQEEGKPGNEDRGKLSPKFLTSQTKVQSTAIRMRLEGANHAPKISGVDMLAGKSNYFIGNDPKKWRSNVASYKKLRYQEVYPGIDLVYYGKQRQLEYDFVVQPGADPKVIQLAFSGIESYTIETGGDLVLHTALGDVIQKKPVIYQQIAGQQVAVVGSYKSLDDERVTFQLGDYDNRLALVIDPVLEYSTFLGASSLGRGIAVDADGNAYVTGYTENGTFPTTTGAFDEIHNAGGTDVFVSKLNATGSELVYSTFLGGSGYDRSNAIAVDAAGNAYVTGVTGDDIIDFPTTTGAFDEIHNAGDTDAFVTKLNATGSELVYSTFLGGSDSDYGYDIAVDAAGSAYVTGHTTESATNFPTTFGAFNEIHNGGSDVFVSKLNATGSGLEYSTFLGGSDTDLGEDITVDVDGNAYVTGSTYNDDISNFPTTQGAFDQSHNGMWDVFVSKLNAAGSGLVYSTFLGGSRFDLGLAIAVDVDGNAYVTGSGYSDFPTTSGALDEIHNGGGTDVFVSKLNAAGSGLEYSTFLGGRTRDRGYGIAVDLDGNAYITGTTEESDTDEISTGFPITPGAFDESHNGEPDVFVSKLNPAGSALLYSTFLGGAELDVGQGIAVDTDGNAYVTGYTAEGGIPTTAGAFEESHNFEGSEAFVTKLVMPIVTTEPLWISVDRSSDDAEEQVSNGNMDLTSSDLELTRELSSQLIGIRFNGLSIPPGATIVNAYIQFTVDETGSEETVLTLQAEAIANAETFSSNNFDISNRMPTTAQVEWAVQPWNTKAAAGSDQATPNLAAIVQEVIDNGDWASGNSVAFIITGSGKRVAESFTGTARPMLHLEFSTIQAVDDGTPTNPAYSTSLGQLLTVPNGEEDIVERNDDVGYPAAVVIGFGPDGSFLAGQQGYSKEEGDLTVYADGSFSYTPLTGFFGVDYFDYVLENSGGQDTARVYIEVLNETPLWIPVDRSSDDAEEASDGIMDLTSSDLELTRESSNQQIGIRFNGLSIPLGATIQEAYIQFQADETDTEETILMFKAEDTGNAATFNNSVIDFDISKRILTAARVKWNVPAWNSVGEAGPEQATPDLSIIIQEVVNRDDWAPDNSIAFIITGSGRRIAESYNGTAPPTLHLIYSIRPPVKQVPDAVDDGTLVDPAYTTNSLGLTVPNGAEDIVERNDDINFLAAEVFSFGATGGESLAGEQGQSADGGDLTVNADGSFSYTPRIGFSGVDSFDYVLKNSEGQDVATVFIEVLNETSMWISVDRNSDDAEEQLSNGIMDLTSSDLELIRELDNQQVGIRFNGLAIPQGATIVEAYIQFQVDETSSKQTVLTLQAEDTANAMTFSNTGFDISNRTPTLAQMQWTVPAWNTIGAAGFDQATPNLAAIVQEVTDRGDWVLGNSMAFIITGSGRRVAESFNGTAPPTLHVTYTYVLDE